jgi:alpha-amylase
MGVIMQAFYWDCPRLEGKEYQWWNHVKAELFVLKTAGFTALWLPPASKAANIGGMSMGYDVYDYYDLGRYPQKSVRKISGKDEVRTWFGSEEELRSLIRAAHTSGLKVYADLVLNHNNGADAAEYNPITNRTWWTRFTPQSGLFTRDWTCFNPSPYRAWDVTAFGDMPDLCHINPRVSTGILNHAKWMIEEIGFDGFRYDFVKGFGAWIIRAIHDRSYTRGGKPVEVSGMGECWAGDDYIDSWLDEVNSWAAHRVGAFDFPLRYRLKELCDSYGFSLRRLVEGGVLMKERPFEAVTFVDNHDFRGGDNPGIVNDKMLAYAFILTHEGYPCVFWQDYYAWGLGREGERDGIAALVRVHEDHAGGDTSVLHVDDNLYIMQRNGFGDQKGLIFVMNNRGDAWNGAWVRTQWKNATLIPAAWGGRNDTDVPRELRTLRDGSGECFAPPRGYVVYVPEG